MIPTVKTFIASTLFVAALVIVTIPAYAVDPRVSRACVGDYLSLCSAHDPESPGVRKCFRANGAKLSSKCLNALVAAGEVSKAEIARKAGGR
jgi:hypothetical protein